MDRPGERIEAEEDKLLSRQIVHFKNDFTLILQFLVSDREYFSTYCSCNVTVSAELDIKEDVLHHHDLMTVRNRILHEDHAIVVFGKWPVFRRKWKVKVEMQKSFKSVIFSD